MGFVLKWYRILRLFDFVTSRVSDKVGFWGKEMSISLFGRAGALALLATLGIAFTGAAQAQLAGQAGSRGAVPGFPACPDSAAPPAEIDTPCLAIVDFDDTVAPGDRAGLVRSAGAVMRFGLRAMNSAAAMVPNEDAWWSLALDPAVTRLWPDLPMHAIAPDKCSPWPDCKNGGGGEEPPPSQTLGEGYLRIGGHLVAQTGANIGVAIIDTGLDSDHADLAANIAGGANCLAECLVDGWEDDNGHGTHVGGIVAALDNDIDMVGVAPQAKLHAIKVLDATGSGNLSSVIDALELVSSRSDIQVANLSLGAPGDCATDAPVLQAAIDAATAAGISVVAAAGNDRNVEISGMIPAGCAGVISVASTTATDGRSSCRRLPAGIPADTASFFTTDGPGVTVSAPGEAREDNNCATIQPVGILSLALGGGTTRMYGTSMAAPHVAGVAALMRQANASLSPADAAAILGITADLAGQAPYDHPYVLESLDGVLEGIVDAAVAAAQAAGTP